MLKEREDRVNPPALGTSMCFGCPAGSDYGKAWVGVTLDPTGQVTLGVTLTLTPKT